MDLTSRRAFEKGRFEVLRKEKNGLTDSDGGVIFYVISPDWFQIWKEFLQGHNYIPPIIDNNILKYLIKDQRTKLGSRLDSEDVLGLKEGIDYNIVSPSLWKLLFDQYDCNCIIRIKYNKIHQLLTERSI
jgi:hypothetical protein